MSVPKLANEWKTKQQVSAECSDCGWRSDAPNGHGLGAQHARRNRHYVRVEVVRSYHYDPNPGEAPS